MKKFKTPLLLLVLFLSINNLFAQRTIIKRPALLIIECNKDLYLNILHEQWKTELGIDNESLKNKIYNDIILNLSDSLKKQYLVRNLNENTFSSSNIPELINKNVGYFLDVIPDYKDYKKDKKHGYYESNLQKGNLKKSKRKRKRKNEKTLPNTNDKFLNIKFYNNDIFDAINKQGFRYVLFITEIIIEKDLSGKYNNQTIIKFDYAIFNTRGKELYGSRSVSVIEKPNYEYFKTGVLPDLSHKVTNRLNFEKIKQKNAESIKN